jgi:hypothetical protein
MRGGRSSAPRRGLRASVAQARVAPADRVVQARAGLADTAAAANAANGDLRAPDALLQQSIMRPTMGRGCVRLRVG